MIFKNNPKLPQYPLATEEYENNEYNNNNNNSKKTKEVRMGLGIRALPKRILCNILIQLDNKTLYTLSKITASDGFSLREECDLVFIYKKCLSIERQLYKNGGGSGLMMIDFSKRINNNKDKKDFNDNNDSNKNNSNNGVSEEDLQKNTDSEHVEEDGSTLRDDCDDESEYKVTDDLCGLEDKVLENGKICKDKVNVRQEHLEEEQGKENMDVLENEDLLLELDNETNKINVLNLDIEKETNQNNSASSSSEDSSYISSTPTKEKSHSLETHQEIVEKFENALKIFDDELKDQENPLLFKPLHMKKKQDNQNNLLTSSISEKIKFFESQIQTHSNGSTPSP
ncbi:hypothetical protein HANVADRAFT_52510 [Hanseniaspora valbyensis NRRL Y-1626]|uniref:F-box domain-containing protein n=1 Tax=Hanseniaspora valbyensis NRRL Y-1626 TaxID=766949 RepID=A0A1B7TEQ4_9ASCO|nr:hypothetical protein HANVADRAFT_52510 [Hanseniaspora valbyensis NRRL Y-1626]